MSLFPIAASNMDVIIGIIAVIGWILAQILGKKKGEATRQDNSDPESDPALDPREEIRRFFIPKVGSAGTPRPTQPQKLTQDVMMPSSLPQKVAGEIPHPTHTSPAPTFRNPLALRQFIIASEILGKPIALR